VPGVDDEDEVDVAVAQPLGTAQDGGVRHCDLVPAAGDVLAGDRDVSESGGDMGGIGISAEGEFCFDEQDP
jgi:hypothetical protein